MKRKILSLLFLLVFLLTTVVSAASFDSVTMEMLERNNCTINIAENSNLERSVVSVDLEKKEIVLQLKVTNTELTKVKDGEIMLVLDNSDSMTEVVSGTTTRRDLVINSANTLVENLLENNPNVKIGAVSFSSSAEVTQEGTLQDATLVSELTNNKDELLNAISSVQSIGVRTDLDAGITLANQYFTQNEDSKYMIILSDGVPNIALDYDKKYYSDDVINKTNSKLTTIQNSGINIITLLTGINNEDAIATGTEKTYKQIIDEIFGTEENPTAGDFYYITDNEIEETITETIYNSLLTDAQTIEDIIVRDYFPQEIVDNFNFEYVTEPNIGTISEAIDTQTNSITWNIGDLAPQETAIVQYKLTLKDEFDDEIIDKILDTNENLEISYKDIDGTTKTDSSDVTPTLRLTAIPQEPNVAPTPLPSTGSPIIFGSILVISGICVFFLIRFITLRNKMK